MPSESERRREMPVPSGANNPSEDPDRAAIRDKLEQMLQITDDALSSIDATTAERQLQQHRQQGGQ